MDAKSEENVLRFSTRDLPEAIRREMFCDMIAKQVLKIRVHPLKSAALDVNMQFRALPGLGIATGRLSPMRTEHLASIADNDDLILVVTNNTHMAVRQNQRAIDAAPGQAVLTGSGEIGMIEGAGTARMLNLCFKRDRLREMVPQAEDWLARALPSSNALSLLNGYVRLIQSHSHKSLDAAIADHIYDLTVLAMGATGEARHMAVRGVKAARIARIKQDILSHLRDSDLSSETLCLRHSISARYLRKLFEDEYTTLTDFISTARVEAAHTLLRDPAHIGRSISDIAFEVGFSDLSYFNRLFRRHFGTTPSSVRDAGP